MPKYKGLIGISYSRPQATRNSSTSSGYIKAVLHHHNAFEFGGAARS